jgi:hypothetical protein
LTRHWRRWAVSAVLAAGFASGGGGATELDSPLARTEAVVDGPREGPYVGEMLLLRLRSFIQGRVALQDIRQPDLVNFDWQQFGVDSEIETVIGGVTTRGIERVIALYPRRAGRLTIEPFTRRVTLLTRDNERVERIFASDPVAIDVRPHDGVGRAGDWWLPARSVTLTDSWEPPPDRIGLNDTARRTISIEAVGLTADRLPPAPPMRTPGVIVFAGPADRKTIATDAGPVARAVYRFDVRPVSGDPAQMPAVHIPWFDVVQRRMRDASIPARTVAFVNPMAPPGSPAGHAQEAAPWRALLTAASFAWAAALAWLVATSRVWRAGPSLWFGPARAALRALRRAGRTDDGRAFRAAINRLSRIAPARWRLIAAEPVVAGPLAALDRALFSAGGTPAPPLVPLARTISAAWIEAAANERSGGKGARLERGAVK